MSGFAHAETLSKGVDMRLGAAREAGE